MPFSLQSAKYIDQRTQDLVSGYLRDIQSSFPYQDKSFYIIPQLIRMIILIFYHSEYFSIAGNFILIHKPDRNKISFDDQEHHSTKGIAYGNVNIAGHLQAKYVWTFSLTELESSGIGNISIGISAGKIMQTDLNQQISDCDDEFPYYELYCIYSLFTGSYVRCGTNQDQCRVYDEYYAPEHSDYDSDQSDDEADVFKENDEIRMELDVECQTLKYFINEKKYGAWFENVVFDKEKIYNMAVCFEDIFSCSVSLTDFQVIE